MKNSGTKRKRSLSGPKIPDVYTTKKRRVSVTEVNDPDLEALPSDTEVALQSLRQYYEQHVPDAKIPPAILKNQIYSYVTDRTGVDRELNQLQENHKIRIFKILCLTDEYAILLTEDYVRLINNAKATWKDPSATLIFDNFSELVTTKSLGLTISKQMIMDLAGSTSKKNTQLLVRSGLLVSRDKSSYWFNIPGTGTLYSTCLAARKEILQILNRQRFKETLEQDLLKKKLRYVKLDIGVVYHIKDMIGANILARKMTTSGSLIHIHPSYDEKY